MTHSMRPETLHRTHKCLSGFWEIKYCIECHVNAVTENKKPATAMGNDREELLLLLNSQSNNGIIKLKTVVFFRGEGYYLKNQGKLGFYFPLPPNSVVRSLSKDQRKKGEWFCHLKVSCCRP